MKTILLVLLSIAALAIAGPGQKRTGPLTLTWDAPDPIDQVDAYNIYVSTNLWPELTLPVPRAPGLLAVVPPITATNVFKFFMSVPGDQLQTTITNTWTELGQYAFFTITASNLVAESPFSNVAWIPALPSYQNRNVTLRFSGE
jgi:hypothetical protein